MRANVVFALALSASVTAWEGATAQGWDSLHVGSRVSVRVSDAALPPGLGRKNAIVGLVAGRDAQAVYLRITSDDTVRITRTAITRLDVSRGISRRRNALRLGLLEGLLFTVLPPPHGEYFDVDHRRGIVFGAVIGGVLGAAIPLEDWKRVRP